MQAHAQASKQKAAGQSAAATAPATDAQGNEAFRIPTASQSEPLGHSAAAHAEHQHHYQHASSQHNGSRQDGDARAGYLPAEQVAGPAPPAWNEPGADAAGLEEQAGEACCTAMFGSNSESLRKLREGPTAFQHVLCCMVI